MHFTSCEQLVLLRLLAPLSPVSPMLYMLMGQGREATMLYLMKSQTANCCQEPKIKMTGLPLHTLPILNLHICWCVVQLLSILFFCNRREACPVRVRNNGEVKVQGKRRDMGLWFKSGAKTSYALQAPVPCLSHAHEIEMDGDHNNILTLTSPPHKSQFTIQSSITLQ